jgi:ATP-dependent Clp protease ATP-binding subunit ClpC
MSRLTRRAERIIELAKDLAAKENDHDFTGSEHLLLAIVREGSGVGAQLLREQGVTEARVRREIQRLGPAASHETMVVGQQPGTPNYMDVMSRAVQVARGTSRNSSNWQICSVHLLVGLLGARESTGCKVLRMLGITSETFRRGLAQAVSDRSGAGRPAVATTSAGSCRESAA